MHDITQHQAIIWQRLDASGHDYAALETSEHGPRLSGCAIFVEDGINCLLHYQVDCAPDWSTRRATTRLSRWPAHRTAAGSRRRAPLAAQRRGAAAGARLRRHRSGLHPATNLLPIRRGRLEIGAALELSAAWLQFPALTLAPLPQRYTRLSELGYRYESRQGAFQAEISVTPDGRARLSGPVAGSALTWNACASGRPRRKTSSG